MSKKRIKPSGSSVYHITSRIAHKEFLLDNDEKSIFVNIMRRAAVFSGVEILTYCIMSNHFHILVRVPKREEIDDNTLLQRVRVLYGEEKFEKLLMQFKQWEDCNLQVRIDEALAKFRERMYDISEFAKTLKHYASNSYNKRNKHEGTLWSGRFSSTIVEDNQKTLMAVGAYIDLNPVRAKMVDHPGQYAWSGFGAAQIGSDTAREGLQNMLHDKSWENACQEYGEYLTSALSYDTKSKAHIRQLMRSHRIAYFTKGAVIGSADFVLRVYEEHYMQNNQKRPKAAPFRNMQNEGLSALRDIRLNAVTPSS